ncbi:hypothetical protein [Methanobrevibacter sp.]|uniref:hypothetical protein n=1 Tax=Methanobrevibacter sp. TaxID=66852 RepID=UPI0038707D4F
MNFKKIFNIVLIFLILLISLCAVSAQDNNTQIISQDIVSSENADIDYVGNVCSDSRIDAPIEINEIDLYYKEDTVLEGHIKGIDETPIKNKQIAMFIEGKQYNKTSDDLGMVLFDLNLKPNSYQEVTADENGISNLNKNLKAGTYETPVQIKDSKNNYYVPYKNSKTNEGTKVKSPAGEDCCSFYLQVSNTESVGGFRRDNTGSTTITVKDCTIKGLSAVKHSNSNGFVHLIVFSNGWIVGNGGLDSTTFIKKMESLAVDMIKSGKIKMSSIKKIYMYKRSINFGHFAIKAPNGEYAVVWKNKIITGKLKPGEFLCTPNFKQYARHSTYGKYSKNLAKAAIKVGATDKYGVNRRQIVVLHWKANSDKNYKTSSSVKCYAANDNGKFVGVSSGRLVDTVKFKSNTVSGHKLPKVPKMKYMGFHKFGNIDKLIKTPTTVKAPNVKNHVNAAKCFNVKVINKNTKKVIKGVKVKIKLTSTGRSQIFTVKTDRNGVAKLNTKTLKAGSYNVVIGTADYKYQISGKSKITII